MRDYKITRNKGEWYNTIVTDSYGKKYQNYFEHADEASEYLDSAIADTYIDNLEEIIEDLK